MPLAKHLPDFTTQLMETPSPFNPLGVKGMGETPTISAVPAVVNAVADALSHRGSDRTGHTAQARTGLEGDKRDKISVSRWVISRG